MKQQTGNIQARDSGGRIAEKPGCGPSVDTWPILDAQGNQIADEAEEEEEEEEEEE
jgi:hypothetical protein